MGVGVGQRSETVVVLLASRIPKRQLNVLSIHLDIGNVVLEDGGDVDLWVAGLDFFSRVISGNKTFPGLSCAGDGGLGGKCEFWDWRFS